MTRCAYCGAETAHPRFCSKSHSARYQARGAQMFCGFCGVEYGARTGHGCFCREICAEAYEARQREKAEDELRQFAQRHGIAA